MDMAQLYAMIAEIQEEAQREDSIIRDGRQKLAQLTAASEQLRAQLHDIQEENTRLSDQLAEKKAEVRRRAHVLDSIYLDLLAPRKERLESALELVSELPELPPLGNAACRCEALRRVMDSVAEEFSRLDGFLAHLRDNIPKMSEMLQQHQRAMEARTSHPSVGVSPHSAIAEPQCHSTLWKDSSGPVSLHNTAASCVSKRERPCYDGEAVERHVQQFEETEQTLAAGQRLQVPHDLRDQERYRSFKVRFERNTGDQDVASSFHSAVRPTPQLPGSRVSCSSQPKSRKTLFISS